MKDRLPAVSGTFYPSDPEELKSELSSLFENPSLTIDNNIAALIVPHAAMSFQENRCCSIFTT